MAISLAAGLGCVIAFWILGLVFTRSSLAFTNGSIIPFLLGLIGCLILVFVASSEMKSILAGIIAPSLIIFGLFFLAILMEGTVEWGHVIIIIEVIVAAISGLNIALLLKRMLKNNKKDPV